MPFLERVLINFRGYIHCLSSQDYPKIIDLLEETLVILIPAGFSFPNTKAINLAKHLNWKHGFETVSIWIGNCTLPSKLVWKHLASPQKCTKIPSKNPQIPQNSSPAMLEKKNTTRWAPTNHKWSCIPKKMALQIGKWGYFTPINQIMGDL